MDNLKYPETPMLDKIHKIKPFSQNIGDFLEWLEEQGMRICSLVGREGFKEWAPIPQGKIRLLEPYFGIDQNQAEEERKAVLEFARLRYPESREGNGQKAE